MTTLTQNRRSPLLRRRTDLRLTPLSSYERPPKASDADGNGLVLAFVLGAWSAESWKFVSEHRMTAPFWMPMSALPMPGDCDE
jgi:hypothetical protein